MRSMIVVAAIMAIVAVGIGTFVIAEELKPITVTNESAGDAAQPVQPVKRGQYRDLNWFRWVKLGAAPYVNPAEAKRMAVAYRYDATAVRGADAYRDAWLAAFNSGEVQLAAVQDDVYVVDPLVLEQELLSAKADVSQATLPENILSAIFSLLELGADVVLISTSPFLPGAEPTGKVVSWDARDWSTAGDKSRSVGPPEAR